jgi:hypothetical protein
MNICGPLGPDAMRFSPGRPPADARVPLLHRPVYVPLALLGDTLHAFAVQPGHVCARVRPVRRATRPVAPGSACRSPPRFSSPWAMWLRPAEAAGSPALAGPPASFPIPSRPESPSLRADPDGHGTNFSLNSENAQRVELASSTKQMIRSSSRATAHNWHGYLPGVGSRAALRVPRIPWAPEGAPVQPACC